MTHVPHHRSLQLSSKKRALLHTRLQAENVKLTPTQIIPHREHTGPVPLSFAQQRLWFLHQLEPDNAFYNICRAFFLTGALDTPVLKQCLDEIVRRHEALRTTFLDIEGRPFQLIAPTLRLSLPVIDLEALSAMEQASEVDRFSLQEACQAFDLTRGPLLRVRLFHLGDEEHVILLTLHHSISDGWSMGVFFREFAALYTAYVTHTPSPLSDLPVQYADFAVWQREGRQEHLLDEQQSYWRGQLDTLPNLQLPLDYPRPAVQSFRGAVQHFVLPKTLTKALTALGLREECTLFMVLLAAFQVLLSRYTRQVDIAVGSLVANRRRTELESLIGFFANTLVLRTDLSGDPPFLELLKRVREVTLDAYTHQDVPFERLVEELKPDRDLSRNPLVQVAFSLQNAPAQDLELSGLKLKLAVIHTKTAKFDLNLMLSEKPEGLAGALEYNTDLFDASTISRLRTHFQTLLEGIVASPERPLSRLSLLTEAERHALTPRKHSQAASTPRACLHHLFEEQVQKIPDAIALVHEDHHLTYHQLNQHANRLARRLQTLGVGPEVRVGICVERSFEMIIGIVAILKAGGSYVPLDPDYPSERLVFMLADASISILLTQQRHLLALPEHAVQGVSLVDIHESLAEEASTATPVSEVRVANAAYVIYTSGSTGAPKGTVISHGNVARLLDVTQQWFRFHEQDIWTLFHSYAFDFSVWELWGALRYGGKLVIVPYLVSRSPQEFYQLLYEEQVTVLNQTPTAFSQLVHAEELSTQQWSLALRFVIFGGEALNFASLQSWFQRHGDRSPQLVNMYGITETTVHVTGYLLTTEDVIRGSSSIIGRTLPDLQEYVLDQHLDLVPVGIPGELYIGGEGLARGYLNRPELTAERFVPHPFSMQPGARLYRTGDLVRWTWEKNLEYLGRVDQQVKLRGFRIELREIETVLCQYPTISEAVVLLREERTGDRRLVAYIVSAPGQEISLSDVQQFLRQKLPAHMLPTGIVVLDHWPLTSNGKLNRQALPAPDASRYLSEKEYTPPRTPVEELLAGIWMDLLGIEQVSIHDDFFALGGHSLLATQVLARIRSLWQVDLPLRSLFSSPTISSLALLINQCLQAEQGLSIPPLRPQPRPDLLPLSFAQQRLWFLDQLA
ncbi:MAG TPA: amino acid adenylation domain-containing protein, partial [Ktedonobacteraceae bacterium]|nr:amino acid adenylation domain-containing protein [Ktedonobacteraceae bacterium]